MEFHTFLYTFIEFIDLFRSTSYGFLSVCKGCWWKTSSCWIKMEEEEEEEEGVFEGSQTERKVGVWR